MLDGSVIGMVDGKVSDPGDRYMGDGVRWGFLRCWMVMASVMEKYRILAGFQ